MKITKREIIKMEVDDVLDMKTINEVENMLNDISCSLGELSDYELINEYNVISSKDICTALMVIDLLLMRDNLEWTVEQKG